MDRFQTTRWSLIEAARGDPADARPALEVLCQAYRPPVLAYVRRSGYSACDAEDLTQEFFLRFLERGWHAHADPRAGRFRALLLAALRNFLIDQHARATAGKRGGGRVALALDPEALADDGDGPERAFMRLWLETVLERAHTRLREEWIRAGKEARFVQLSPLLLEQDDGDALRRLAAETGQRANTLSVQCCRMRQRLRQLVRLELLRTVSNREALEQELAELRGALDAVP